MITKRDLEIRFKSETGESAELNPRDYSNWLEEKYLDKLNEEIKVNEQINDLFIDAEEVNEFEELNNYLGSQQFQEDFKTEHDE